MTTFILVHGAWHGGWCFRDVAQPLQQQGHRVFAPTLTGLGDRRHLATREIDLNTHIEDVVAVFENEELSDVVLLGHSYGGMVITGVAERVSDQIHSLIYLDAFVPESGHSLATSAPKNRHEARMKSVQEEGDGWLLPAPDPSMWAIKDKSKEAWIGRHLAFQPLKTFEQELVHTDPWTRVNKRVFVLAEENNPSPFQQIAEERRNDPTWVVLSAPCHHDIMVDEPELLIQILLDAAP